MQRGSFHFIEMQVYDRGHRSALQLNLRVGELLHTVCVICIRRQSVQLASY